MTLAKAEIAFILPLYNKFIYGRRAALSFFKYTHRPGLVIALDDASPYYPRQDWNAWRKDLPEDRLVFKHFGKNAGLTRSWNEGLAIARSLGVDYAVCGNSDVLFTPNWEEGLIYQVSKNGYSLVGPVTNAPGVTNQGRQRVDNYFPDYDSQNYSPEYLARVAEYCYRQYPAEKVEPCNINGFFMLARTETWWTGSFNDTYVFDPAKAMTGNEDELQRRWHVKGWKTGFVPSSFIYHHRAVSRGERYKHRGWTRITAEDMNKPV